MASTHVLPADYQDRPQSWLKHRVLEEYLEPWVYKLGNGLGSRRPTKLWFVDCFAGPWSTHASDHSDTSPAIALGIFEKARESLLAKGFDVQFGAIFVEESDAYDSLVKLVEPYGGKIDVQTLRGEFGDHVKYINTLLGSDPAFLFVDPLGWKDAPMKFIEPLAKGGRFRDVLVNVMTSFMVRQQKNTNAQSRQNLADFFAIPVEEVADDLTDEQIGDVYCKRLKDVCNFRHAAALAIPKYGKDSDGTYFLLAVGGNHEDVLDVFRNAEAKVCGIDATHVKAELKERMEVARAPGQTDLMSLFTGYTPPAPAVVSRYTMLHDRDVREISRLVGDAIAKGGKRVNEIWPAVLEALHVTRADVKRELTRMCKSGSVKAVLRVGERALADDTVIQRSA